MHNMKNIRSFTLTMLKASYDFKKEIFRHWDTEINRSHINDFLFKLNGFLVSVKNLQKTINENFKKPINEAVEIEVNFDDIKPYIYGDFDYASVLQFTDGICKGLPEGKFNTKVDIDKFYDFMIPRAFDNMAISTEDLISAAESPMQIAHGVSYELASYKIIATWNNLFPAIDFVHIFNSAEKALTFFANQQITSDNVMGALMLSYGYVKIIDYVTYTAILYAIRTLLIYNFSIQFVSGIVKESYEDDLYSKHPNQVATDLSEISEDPSGEVSNIFQITDETIIRDPEKNIELLSRFYKFIETTSGRKLAKDIPSSKDRFYIHPKILRSNRFHNALKNNGLYSLFFGESGYPYDTDIAVLFGDDTRGADRVRLKLLDSLMNPKHGNTTIHSHRHEFLHAIKGLKCDYEDLADCRDCALDLYVLAVMISGRICYVLNNINRYHISAHEDYSRYISTSDKKAIMQIATLLSMFYGEVMMVIVQRAAFLERVINAHLKKSSNEHGDIFKIHTPKEMLKEVIAGANDATLCAVPMTTRMAPGQENYYESTTFEFLESQDMYLASLPEFKDLLYFEAVDGTKISSLINKILAFIKRVFDKAKSLFSTNQFKAIQKWVADRKEKLLAAKFDENPPKKEDQLTVLDYKKTLSTGNAVNINAFKNFIASTKIEEVTDISKWKEEAYKSLLNAEYVAIFNSDKKQDEKARMFKSKLLYNNVKPDGNSDPIVINSNALLGTHMATWVSTVEGADKLTQQFANAESVINGITNDLKAKVLASLNKTITNKPNPDETTVKTENDDKNIDTGNASAIVAAYHEVLAAAYIPIVHYTYEAVINQYKYIQQVFNKSKA